MGPKFGDLKLDREQPWTGVFHKNFSDVELKDRE